MPPTVPATVQSSGESAAATNNRVQPPREGFYRTGEPGIIFGTVSLPADGMSPEQMQVCICLA